MVSILSFARANDTLKTGARGSDPHGWRNALNAYGWGSDAMTDPAKRVYDDRAYRSFNGAVTRGGQAIARGRSRSGSSAGPAGTPRSSRATSSPAPTPGVSSDFTVRYVYLSDPLATGTEPSTAV